MKGILTFIREKRWKKWKKDQWLILFLAGILLLVIAIPTSCEGDSAGSETEPVAAEDSSGSGAYEQELAAQLEETLSQMEGVGRVKVMITFQDSGEAVVEKDVTYSDEETASTENGTSTAQTQSSEETVYSDGSGDGEPYVSRELTPAIEGVLVVAEGGGNSAVVADISEAVEALFGVETHKIKVVKMNEIQEGSD